MVRLASSEQRRRWNLNLEKTRRTVDYESFRCHRRVSVDFLATTDGSRQRDNKNTRAIIKTREPLKNSLRLFKSRGGILTSLKFESIFCHSRI